MFIKIFCLILILKLTEARYGFVPNFYGQDSAVIVDTDKSLAQIKNAGVNVRNKIIVPPPFPLWRYYPRYHIVPAPPRGQILSINTWAKTAKTNTIPISTTKSTSTIITTTTTTTSKPTVRSTNIAISKSSPFKSLENDGEYPIEFLDIAQKKLGLDRLDEIPSLSELSQLLGTDSPEETLSYIKQLTSNEQGIALLKAYIESSDYTDKTGDFNNKNYDLLDEEDEVENIEEPEKSNDDGLVVITDEDSNDDYELNNDRELPESGKSKTTSKQRKMPKIIQKLEELPQTVPSFMGSIANYIHLNENLEHNQLNRITENSKRVYSKQGNQNKENQTKTEIKRYLETEGNLETPILVRDSIPFNYPVPIRVQSTTASTKNISIPSYSPVVHLNTPKMLIPHVRQIARVTKIPSKKIEDFLASKPKLLELVTKVSHFPISYDRNSPIEAQIMAAVQKAFEQDDDLQKLLSSTATLK